MSGGVYFKDNLNVIEYFPPSATVSKIMSSANNQTLAVANTKRRGLLVFNDSTQSLYLKFGVLSSPTSFSVKIAAGAYYEIPHPVYTGRVDGVWGEANGFAMITEAY